MTSRHFFFIYSKINRGKLFENVISTDMVADAQQVGTPEEEAAHGRGNGPAPEGLLKSTEPPGPSITSRDERILEIAQAESKRRLAMEAIGDVMKDTPDERDEFQRLAVSFGFRNPRTLLRLRNSYRMLKALNKGRTYEWRDLMVVLFWEEFLFSQPVSVRHACAASIWEERAIQTIADGEIQATVKRVTRTVSAVLGDDEERQRAIAEFVRTVVLPHVQEGALDSEQSARRWWGSRCQLRQTWTARASQAGDRAHPELRARRGPRDVRQNPRKPSVDLSENGGSKT